MKRLALIAIHHAVAEESYDVGFIVCARALRNQCRVARVGEIVPTDFAWLRVVEGMRGLNQKIGAEAGFRSEGVVYLCYDQAEVAKYEAWLEK